MDFKQDSDVVIDNGESIEVLIDIQESLQNIQKWFAASGAPDLQADRAVEDAIQEADHLYHALIDLQIKLLTNL